MFSFQNIISAVRIFESIFLKAWCGVVAERWSQSIRHFQNSMVHLISAGPSGRSMHMHIPRHGDSGSCCTTCSLGRGNFSIRPYFHLPQPIVMSSVSELLALAKHKLDNGIQDIGHSSTTVASQTSLHIIALPEGLASDDRSRAQELERAAVIYSLRFNRSH